MNILVTGASGFIGFPFCCYATVAGHKLTRLGHHLTDPDVLAVIDWQNFGALVHLAAAGVRRVAPDRTWEDCMAVNFGGTRDLLQSLKVSGATPAVFISGSVREIQTRERPDYWSDPYIVSQRLRRLFVEEWAETYRGRLIYPKCERCGDAEDVAKLCAHILTSIS